MRNFRRLPLFLRTAWVVGFLIPFAALILYVATLLSHADTSRAVAIALNLSLLGQACAFVAMTFSVRLRQPDRRRRFALDSWQRQLRAIMLLAALPLCALMLAVAIPSTYDVARNVILFVNILALFWPLSGFVLLVLG